MIPPGAPFTNERGFPLIPQTKRWPATPPYPVVGHPIWRRVPDFDKGAAAFGPKFPQPFTNPIGAGVPYCYGPRAFYLAPRLFVPGVPYGLPQPNWLAGSLPAQGLVDPATIVAQMGGPNNAIGVVPASYTQTV